MGTPIEAGHGVAAIKTDSTLCQPAASPSCCQSDILSAHAAIARVNGVNMLAIRVLFLSREAFWSSPAASALFIKNNVESS